MSVWCGNSSGLDTNSNTVQNQVIILLYRPCCELAAHVETGSGDSADWNLARLEVPTNTTCLIGRESEDMADHHRQFTDTQVIYGCMLLKNCTRLLSLDVTDTALCCQGPPESLPKIS